MSQVPVADFFLYFSPKYFLWVVLSLSASVVNIVRKDGGEG
jgi:hypothetical protein